MSLNTILIIVTLAVIFVFITYMYMHSKGKEEIKYEAVYETLDDVLNAVRQEMVDIIREDTNLTRGSSVRSLWRAGVQRGYPPFRPTG